MLLHHHELECDAKLEQFWLKFKVKSTDSKGSESDSQVFYPVFFFSIAVLNHVQIALSMYTSAFLLYQKKSAEKVSVN